MVLGLSCDFARNAYHRYPNGDLFPDQKVVVEDVLNVMNFVYKLIMCSEQRISNIYRAWLK